MQTTPSMHYVSLAGFSASPWSESFGRGARRTASAWSRRCRVRRCRCAHATGTCQRRSMRPTRDRRRQGIQEASGEACAMASLHPYRVRGRVARPSATPSMASVGRLAPEALTAAARTLVGVAAAAAAAALALLALTGLGLILWPRSANRRGRAGMGGHGLSDALARVPRSKVGRACCAIQGGPCRPLGRLTGSWESPWRRWPWPACAPCRRSWCQPCPCRSSPPDETFLAGRWSRRGRRVVAVARSLCSEPVASDHARC